MRVNPSGLYCAYLRKSRRDEEMELRGQGETLARHAQALAGLAERLGIRIAQTYREVVSGDTIADRPEVRRLLEDVNAGLWDGVLVMDVDRLGRGDSIDQGVIMQSFLYSDTLIITPDKVYDPSEDSDAEFFEIKLFFSRREYSAIKKRLQRGRLASAMDGCYMGTRPVYGYERVKLQGRKGWSLKVVPEKAAIVRSVFDWYAHGLDGRPAGSMVIADRLNQMGLRTDLGNRFTSSNILHMLQNPVYMGKVLWNQRQTVYRIEDGRRVASRPKSENAVIVDGRHEAIIEEPLWREVQAMFATHARHPGNAAKKLTNPLAGLVVCSECGFHLNAKPSAGRRGPFLTCFTQRCPTYAAYLFAVEDAILKALEGWVEEFSGDADARRRFDASANADTAARKQLAAQREALDEQLRRSYDLLEQGVYTVGEFRQRRADLTARIAAVDEALGGLDSAPKPAPRAALIPRVITVLETYRTCETPEQKNALLRTVVDHVVYHKTQRGYRNNNPGDFLTIEVYPVIPTEDD